MANTSVNINCTEEGTSLDSQPLHQAAVMLLVVAAPVLLLCGTFGNVMTMVVMRGMRAEQSTVCMPIYFTALAVSDLSILLICLPRHWALYVFGFDLRVLSDSTCKIHKFLTYVLGQISAWLLVVMTSQRVTSVVWPLKVCLQGTRRKALLTVSLIVCTSLLYNSSILFSHSVSVFGSCTPKVCSIAQTDSTFRYVGLFLWLDIAMFSVIPFCILCICNIVLLWKVTQSVRTARGMTGPGHVNPRAKRASSLTVIIVTTSAAFLVLTLPSCVIPVYIHTQNVTAVEDIQSRAKLSLATAVSVLLWYCNCSVNFYLYCLSGTKLRNEAKTKLMSVMLMCNFRQV